MEIEQNDNAGDGLDLGQLMDQIRKDAERRKRVSLNNGAPEFFKRLTTQGFEVLQPSASHLSSLSDLKLQAPLEKREQYEIGDLLGYHDEAFVRNAYKVILKRDPDDSGFATYLKNLRSGRYSKIDILRSLRFSPEGRNANVTIKGLGPLASFRRLYRVPVVGYVLQLAVAIVRLPVLIANLRRLESHTAAQLERVASHVNEAIAQFSEADRRQTETSRRQFEVVQEHLINEQGRINQEILTRLDETAERAATESQAHEQRVTKLDTEVNAELAELKIRVAKEVEALIERLQHVRMDVGQQETRLSYLLDTSGEDRPKAIKHEDQHRFDSLYYQLENVLRGTPEEIKEQVKVYIPVLQQAGITSGVLDVGCGRGEWLEVLREAGVEAKGIDQNRILIAKCKALSLDVIETDAMTYLGSLANESLNAVTAFHFAEHLPFKTLVQFLDEAGRVLKPNSLLILETPNPENLVVGSCNFYLDPTHKHPIPVQTMKLLLEARGFRCEEVMKLHPISSEIEVKDQLTSHLNHFLYGPMNYAVVARKPQSYS